MPGLSNYDIPKYEIGFRNRERSNGFGTIKFYHHAKPGVVSVCAKPFLLCNVSE